MTNIEELPIKIHTDLENEYVFFKEKLWDILSKGQNILKKYSQEEVENMIAILYRIGNIDTALTLANQLFKLNSPEKYKDLHFENWENKLFNIKADLINIMDGKEDFDFITRLKTPYSIDRKYKRWFYSNQYNDIYWLKIKVKNNKQFFINREYIVDELKNYFWNIKLHYDFMEWHWLLPPLLPKKIYYAIDNVGDQIQIKIINEQFDKSIDWTTYFIYKWFNIDNIQYTSKYEMISRLLFFYLYNMNQELFYKVMYNDFLLKDEDKIHKSKLIDKTIKSNIKDDEYVRWLYPDYIKKNIRFIPKDQSHQSQWYVLQDLIKHIPQDLHSVVQYTRQSLFKDFLMFKNDQLSNFILFKWSDLPLVPKIFINERLHVSVNNYYSVNDLAVEKLNEKLFEYHNVTNMWLNLLERLKTVRIGCINYTTYSSFKNLWFDNIFYIPRWVDTNQFYSQNKSRNWKFVVWCIIKSSMWHKWWDIINLLNQKLQNSSIWLEILDNDWLIWDKISHHEMNAWYNWLDCFLIVSQKEWAPNSLLEAWACKLPIIATKVGYAEDVLWGKWEILETTDTDLIYNAIMKYKTNTDYRSKSADQIHTYIVWTYSWEKQIDKMISFLK